MSGERVDGCLTGCLEGRHAERPQDGRLVARPERRFDSGVSRAKQIADPVLAVEPELAAGTEDGSRRELIAGERLDVGWDANSKDDVEVLVERLVRIDEDFVGVLGVAFGVVPTLTSPRFAAPDERLRFLDRKALPEREDRAHDSCASRRYWNQGRAAASCRAATCELDFERRPHTIDRRSKVEDVLELATRLPHATRMRASRLSRRSYGRSQGVPGVTDDERGHMAYLYVLTHVAGLIWVVEESKAGFPRRWREVMALRPGDRLFLYCGREVFPDRRARVVGEASVTSTVETPSSPIQVASRSLKLICGISPLWLVPSSKGVPFRQFAERLQPFSRSGSYPIVLRRPLVELRPEDADFLRRINADDAVQPEVALSTYR